MAQGGPVGSDTVNAWLTPGEFVVNRNAAARNFALLSSINSNRSGSSYYSHGGAVNTFNNTFNSTQSSNLKINTRRSAAELRRQIGLGQVTLQPKTRIPF